MMHEVNVLIIKEERFIRNHYINKIFTYTSFGGRKEAF